MCMDELDHRVDVLENRTNGLSEEVGLLRQTQEAHLERYSQSFEDLAKEIKGAIHFQSKFLDAQAKSLPISEVMKLFTFFAVLTFGVVGGVLGIKWLALDLLR